MINNILETGIFPDELKNAKIIPIYKNGKRDDLNNYRPISLLSNFSKLVEKIIKIRIVRFIQQNFNFDRQQYGFQKGCNALGAVSDLLEYVSGEIDQQKYVVAVFVDLKKAFDTVNIEVLLEKTTKMGFRGPCESLLRTYSVGRRHYTTVNGQVSDTETLDVGVAQGSVLGPLLYLLYVHNLQYVGLRAKYFMFADDTVLVLSASNIKDLEKGINCDLELYHKWLCYNKLSINTTKTVYMTINNINKQKGDTSIFFDGVKLGEVTDYKYLGLNINNKLTWNNHIQKN